MMLPCLTFYYNIHFLLRVIYLNWSSTHHYKWRHRRSTIYLVEHCCCLKIHVFKLIFPLKFSKVANLIPHSGGDEYCLMKSLHLISLFQRLKNNWTNLSLAQWVMQPCSLGRKVELQVLLKKQQGWGERNFLKKMYVGKKIE